MKRKKLQIVLSSWRNGATVSKKEILETIGGYVNENKIPTPFRGGVPGDDFFNRFKRTHNLSLKKPQSIEVMSGEVSERMKETVSKNVKYRNKKQPRKKKRVLIMNNCNRK
jgi:hypothetical protein